MAWDVGMDRPGNLPRRDGLSGNIVRAIAEDAGGNLWVGTENRGLNCFKDGKFTSYQASENGLPGNDISCLYADNDGSLVGRHFRPRAGAVSKWKMDPLFHGRRTRQQYHLLHP